MLDVQLQHSPLPLTTWRAHLPPTPVRTLVAGLRKLGFRSTAVADGCVKFVHDGVGSVMWLPATGRLEVIVPYAVPRGRRATTARAIATLVERATLGAS